MKKFKLEVIIDEIDGPFWSEINNRCTSGCEEVVEAVYDAISKAGLSPTVIFKNYSEKHE